MTRRLLALLVGAAALLLACSSPAAPPPTSDVVALTAVPGGIAAASRLHGPTRVVDGLASGFSHDEVGAALAANNIGARITPAAGPEVTMATLAGQCWGDLAQARRLSGAAIAPAAQPHLVPTTLWFRVLAGDPAGQQVVVSLLADTPQARAAGGLARVDATLRWSDGDWRLRVPTGRAGVHPRVAGYRLLAPVGDPS